jgi:hypothetical protein
VTGADQVVPPFADVRYWYQATPEPGESMAPEPVMVTLAAFVHDSDPPATVGSVGGVRSILVVFVAPPVPGFHADALPALSTLRSWVTVAPSAVITPALPVAGADQVAPLSVELRYS